MTEEKIIPVEQALPEQTEQIEIKEEKTPDLGKFKDVESLLSAYKNLEAEFTKKSQLLKSLSDKENPTKVEPEAEEMPQDVTADNESSPAKAVYEREDWKQKVADFTRDRDISPQDAEKIADEILSDDNLRYDENCLEKGYIRYLEKKASSVNDFESVERFLDENPDVKQSVIRSFISKNDLLPPNPSQRGTFVITPPYKPKTIREAGAALENTIKENKSK